VTDSTGTVPEWRTGPECEPHKVYLERDGHPTIELLPIRGFDHIRADGTRCVLYRAYGPPGELCPGGYALRISPDDENAYVLVPTEATMFGRVFAAPDPIQQNNN
jgi:hypothetical protein